MATLSNEDVFKLIKISHAFYKTISCYIRQVNASKLAARSSPNYEHLYKELASTLEEEAAMLTDIFDNLDMFTSRALN